MKRYIALILLLAWREAGAQPIEFTLKVTPANGTLNDQYVATVQIVTRGVSGPDRFWPPDLAEFDVVDQHSSQPSIQWMHDATRGQEIRSLETRRYVLRPRRAGKLRIGEARLQLDGAEFQTRPALVVVVDAAHGGQPPSTNPGLRADAPPSSGQVPLPPESEVEPTFIHGVVDRTKVYVGEQVTASWYLYTRSEILKYEPKAPRFDDLWAEPLYEPQNYLTYTEAVLGHRTYHVALVGKRALFPTRSGKVVISKLEASVGTMATSFGQPLQLASREIELNVQPLPPGAPSGFDPAYVGHFTLEAAADRDSVAAGESVSLTLTVRGAGALRRTKIPKLIFDEFTVYEPRTFEEKLDSSTGIMRGERRYVYVLTPRKGGNLSLGPVEIPYFDPVANRYDVARSEALPLKIIGDPTRASGATGRSGENLIGRDIRPAREIGVARSRLVAAAWSWRYFWVVLVAPPVMFLVTILGDNVRERLRRETPRARLRRARGRARRRLRAAELHIKHGRAGKFFGEMSRVLSEHIEERVGEPVAAMTRERLGSFLEERGFPGETIEALVRELENCDFARFAPSASGPGEMRAALRRVRALLAAIERVRPVHARDEVAA